MLGGDVDISFPKDLRDAVNTDPSWCASRILSLHPLDASILALFMMTTAFKIARNLKQDKQQWI